ncbi:translation initiation factor IF-2, partial [Mesorhizobium sp. M4A.F.Ca.ET.090.04.2.1]|uniref:translation initiation factor IF-2 associated domain-containing protein n=1 Tax=Mesorhizobium sp. M4A.F.Ca.ET.090.04.2.1 TaxID=2496663 RepID=UPI000FD49A8E
MSDTKSGDDKTLSVTPKKTLTLKRPGMEQGTVRQNFSHGRTKAVVVETKKRKFSLPGDKPEPAAAPVSVFTPKPVAAAAPAVQEAPKAPPPPPERGGMVLNELSRSEMEARRKALEGSKAREIEDRQRAQEEAKRRAEEEERRKREREDSARRQAEEEARLQTEAESRRRAEEEARRRAPLAAELATPDDEEDVKPKRAGAGAPVRRLVTPEVARPAKPTQGEED